MVIIVKLSNRFVVPFDSYSPKAEEKTVSLFFLQLFPSLLSLNFLTAFTSTTKETIKILA